MRTLPIIFILTTLLFGSCSSDDPVVQQMNNMTITPNSGIGDISFSDNGNKIMDEYGLYERLTAIVSLNDAAFVMWYDNGLAFQLDHVDVGDISLQEISDRSSELIELDQKIIQMIIMTPFKGMTKEGIGLGSSRADVVATYGEPDKIGSSTEEYEALNINIWYNSSGNIRRIDLKP